MDKFITSFKAPTDYETENTLRPQTLLEYVGQEKTKKSLNVYITAAKKRGDALDHIMLYGPPGLGKTTLANIVANSLNSNIKVTSGPVIESAADLAAILTALQKNDVLFIDEIHALGKTCEEILYSAMEDFALDVVLGKGPSARTMRLKLQPFTLIGATTKVGKLSAPLRNRFGIVYRLEIYTPKELSTIISRSAKILNVDIKPEALDLLANASRGTPRIANRILKRVRDFAEVENNSIITQSVCKDALDMLEIDSLGLDNNDVKVVMTIVEKFKGGPVGLETIANSINEDSGTIEDVIEPYLLQIGFIAKTPRGRIVLPAAYKHFGIKGGPKGEQISF